MAKTKTSNATYDKAFRSRMHEVSLDHWCGWRDTAHEDTQRMPGKHTPSDKEFDKHNAKRSKLPGASSS